MYFTPEVDVPFQVQDPWLEAVVGNLVFQAVLGFGVLVLALFYTRIASFDIKPIPFKSRKTVLLTALFGMILSLVGLGTTTNQSSQSTFVSILDQGNTQAFILFLISAIVIAPIVEEFLFRGIVLGSLRSLIGAKAAIGISALLFGLAHVPTAESGNVLVVVLATSAAGLVLGYVRVESGSLLTSILLHAAINTINSAMLISGFNVYWVVTWLVFISLLLLVMIVENLKRENQEVVLIH